MKKDKKIKEAKVKITKVLTRMCGMAEVECSDGIRRWIKEKQLEG